MPISKSRERDAPCRVHYFLIVSGFIGWTWQSECASELEDCERACVRMSASESESAFEGESERYSETMRELEGVGMSARAREGARERERERLRPQFALFPWCSIAVNPLCVSVFSIPSCSRAPRPRSAVEQQKGWKGQKEDSKPAAQPAAQPAAPPRRGDSWLKRIPLTQNMLYAWLPDALTRDSAGKVVSTKEDISFSAVLKSISTKEYWLQSASRDLHNPSCWFWNYNVFYQKSNIRDRDVLWSTNLHAKKDKKRRRMRRRFVSFSLFIYSFFSPRRVNWWHTHTRALHKHTHTNTQQHIQIHTKNTHTHNYLKHTKIYTNTQIHKDAHTKKKTQTQTQTQTQTLIHIFLFYSKTANWWHTHVFFFPLEDSKLMTHKHTITHTHEESELISHTHTHSELITHTLFYLRIANWSHTHTHERMNEQKNKLHKSTYQ